VTSDEVRRAAAAVAERSADVQGIPERAVEPVTLALVAEIVASARRDDADPASEIGTTGSCSTIPGHRDVTGGRRAS